ncbi:MAG: emp24/gp25L/p24 family/GOLD-domain-containing protein [Piptocephalis tieghemiana]|nr:MAG: emp24/gp25L/p24 family/GOLD-domain-containing protein [Piptocephalis tieghemiana]
MKLPTIASLMALAVLPSLTFSLHFYLHGTKPRCFIEELPKETLVVGHYKAEEWSETMQQYFASPQLGMQITVVEEVSRHRVVNQKGTSDGDFSFTSAEPGRHTLCFTTNTTGWFSDPIVRLTLDLLIGENGADPTEKKDEKISEMFWSIREINNKLVDAAKEQEYQREREEAFRDESERVNSRAVWYTILQMVVLGCTCAWQLNHLRAFFIAKKLV